MSVLSARAPLPKFSVRCRTLQGLDQGTAADADYAKRVLLPFAGEVYMGTPALLHYRKVRHLVRAPVPPEKQLACQESALCGNFNMTNVDEIFARITAIGQHPRKYADTYHAGAVGTSPRPRSGAPLQPCRSGRAGGMDITRYIENHIDLANVLRTSSKEWDGDT